MIHGCQSRQRVERELWSATVRRLFQTLQIDDRATAKDITESLAVFCQQNTLMSEHVLLLLMARSFCFLGDTATAGRILCHDPTHRPHVESWLTILSADHPFRELYPLFSSRTLHPQTLASTGPVWVLDLEKVHWTEADRHELLLFQTVRVLIERISRVWQKTNGQGTLGVKGWSRLSRWVCGPNPSRQLIHHIQDLLTLSTQRNGWAYTPNVLLFTR